MRFKRCRIAMTRHGDAALNHEISRNQMLNARGIANPMSEFADRHVELKSACLSVTGSWDQ